MVEIVDMGMAEMKSLLERIGFGHLGCSRNGRPYVVPLHYVYAEPDVYIYTTEGLKTEFIAANPQVCLQVEEVQSVSRWRSVIVTGRAERITEADEKKSALGLILLENPDLTPAISRTWTDAWGRENVEAIYRIRTEIVSGRKTL